MSSKTAVNRKRKGSQSDLEEPESAAKMAKQAKTPVMLLQEVCAKKVKFVKMIFKNQPEICSF